MSDFGRPQRGAASSPILAVRPASQPQTAKEPSVRQMRLKVLYTFDEDKTNCLARWPHPLEIRTAHLSPETQVGVIELKVCLQAIATASPEIVAGLGQDYTVYAYDYSEYETPLVGQGMLSWLLASASPTPGAPAHQSRTMVTGRVSQNPLGLFSGISQETLEVKLRLVPVPTSKQSEYLESMKQYRDLSQIMPPGFDPQAWTSFLQQNPNFFQQAIQSRAHSPAPTQNERFGIEHVQRLLNNGYQSSSQTGQILSRTQSFANSDIGQQLPRLPSPASSIASTATAPKKRGRKPGSQSKTGKARRGKKEPPPPESTDPGYCTGEERGDEGTSRKRARVVSTEWDGRQDFGKAPESLRVAASTAASVRIHQPTAVRPGIQAELALDSQPRAPTPVANPDQNLRRLRLPARKSGLGRGDQVLVQSPEDAYSPAPMSEKPPELSPDKSHVESSPMEMGSSPPDILGQSTTQSSPLLPGFSRSFEDPNFFTDPFDDLFDDTESRPLDEEDFAMAAQYSKRPEGQPFTTQATDEAALPNLPAPKSVQDKRHKFPAADQSEMAQTVHPSDLSPRLPPPVPASDPVRPAGLPRSQSWAGGEPPHPASDSGIVQSKLIDTKGPSSRLKKRRQSDMGGQSGVRRKAVIQSRLATSIASGEVPPYCDHCGAIETPTWRKAWVKVHSGTPEHVRISEEEGGILAWQTLQTDSKGEVCLYRIVKKTLAKHDEGFTQMLLCNPCGMYLLARKCMRPKEMWDKPREDPDDQSRREPSEGDTQSGRRPASAHTNGSATRRSSDPPPRSEAQRHSDSSRPEPQLPTLRRSATSFSNAVVHDDGGTLDEASAAAALERAIKSSPHKFVGSQQTPIEITDLTPQPTRRILFPSPSQSEKLSSRTQPERDDKSVPASQDRAEPKHAEKDNLPSSSENDIDRFFNEEGYAVASNPPTSATKSKYPWLNHTPSKSPSQRFSVATDSAKKTNQLPPSTPSRTPSKGSRQYPQFTPFTAHLNQLLSDATAGSPGGTNYDFPTLPPLRNTPNSAKLVNFDFSQLDSQDFISTDIPMPSSPPPWNFDSFNDSGEGLEQGLWGNTNLPNSISSPHKGEDPSSDNYESLDNGTLLHNTDLQPETAV